MEHESLPPIPTPVGQRWREFRIKVLPPFIFLGVVGVLVLTWSTLIQPISMVGMVETNTVTVMTAQAGLLTELTLNRFDEVTNGQVIGQIELFDADQIQAELTALGSRAALVGAEAELTEWGKLDNAIMIQLNLFNEYTLLETAKVKLNQASNVVEDDKKMTSQPGPSPIALALARAHLADYEGLRSEVAGRSKLIENWQKQLPHINEGGSNVIENLTKVLTADALNQQEQLRQLQKPILLKAPINGRISSVIHHAGERVPAGAPILTITSSRADRILAYVRQPISFHPKLGDVVTVRTRAGRRRTSEAQIIKVGSQLEPIGPILLPIAKPLPELGLPVALTLPQELDLFPGEIVDLQMATPRN